jgi:hypothetical protein
MLGVGTVLLYLVLALVCFLLARNRVARESLR